MSAGPDDPPSGGRLQAPRLFVFAMMLCMALGFGGITKGFSSLHFFASAEYTELPSLDLDTAEREKFRELWRVSEDLLDRAYRTQVPLAAANLVLSVLLLMVAWRALQGRPGMRGLALQAVVANGALAVVDYALSMPLRAAWVNAAVIYLPRPNLPSPSPIPEEQLGEALGQAIYFFGFRAPFALKLVAYILSLVALALPSARAYLDHVEANRNAEA